jgi:hypothetical protein
MIVGIVLLECTAIGGMGYLIYRLYFWQDHYFLFPPYP